MGAGGPPLAPRAAPGAAAPSAGPVRYGPEILAALDRLCEADPGREACGFVVRRSGVLAVVQVPNAADRLHAEDPVAFPRTARHAYVMEPRAQLRLYRELEAAGGVVVAVWHSHVEAGAHLSEVDRAGALLDGRPVVPGAEHLVLGLRGGRVAERRRYRHLEGAFVGSVLD